MLAKLGLAQAALQAVGSDVSADQSIDWKWSLRHHIPHTARCLKCTKSISFYFRICNHSACPGKHFA